ncbi:hypothetical protein FNF29_05701 [Cafeteria roenbergensis]|uniref:Sodium/solute symporter n=1 Tax=Cafeteria roenbergensis TaxID=33653 RepID=A0A5A8C9S0_CAFRO|nr:hypothetical protein FNF29_05701 [Cafeteria roenbergensis]|eukprot:KAA0149876.1 hypothetical protein FNF29_05701 [Cafeteria roenbergensis]
MPGNDIVVGTDAIVVFCVYLVILIGLGWVGNCQKNASKAESAGKSEAADDMDEHFLAGRSLPPVVLLLTMFASVFSGYTVVGVPSDAFKLGYMALFWVTGTSAVQIGFVLFAPPIQALAFKHRFLSPADFVRFRFAYKPLTLLVSACTLIPTMIYALAQFRAMGSTVGGLTNNALHPVASAGSLAVVMLIYEYLGGMRSVAYADSMQGGLILIAFVFMVAIAHNELGGLEGTVSEVIARAPAFTKIPSAENQVYYVSFSLIFAFTFPFYPHLIQRAYAAKNTKQVAATTAIMGFMPLFVSFASLMLGMIGVARYYDSSDAAAQKAAADGTFALVAGDIMQTGPFGYWVVVMLLCGALAALMSTTDSLLMSMSSSFVNDVIKPFWYPEKTVGCCSTVLCCTQTEGKACMPCCNSGVSLPRTADFYVKSGNIVTLIVCAVNVGLVALDIDLATLFAFQSNILINAAPVYILGILYKDTHPVAAFIGCTVGVVIMAICLLSGNGKLGGWHAGMVASWFNLVIIYGLSYLWREGLMAAEAPEDIRDSSQKDQGSAGQGRGSVVGGGGAIVDAATKHTERPGASVPAGAVLSEEEVETIRRKESTFQRTWGQVLHARFQEPYDAVEGGVFPINRWYVWLSLILNVILCVPFWAGPGSQDWYVGGLTRWAFVAMVFSCILSCNIAICAWFFWPNVNEEVKKAKMERDIAEAKAKMARDASAGVELTGAGAASPAASPTAASAGVAELQSSSAQA